MNEIEGILIPVSGPCRSVRVKRDEFNYHVHQLIDCSLYDIVRVNIGDYDALMLVDDFGLLMQKPCNVRASVLYGNCIVGDVVLVGETYHEGEPDIGSVPMPLPLVVSYLFKKGGVEDDGTVD